MCVISDDESKKADAKFKSYAPETAGVQSGSDSEQIKNDLVLACEAALLLRGLWMAITDPLALAGEKEAHRIQRNRGGNQTGN